MFDDSLDWTAIAEVADLEARKSRRWRELHQYRSILHQPGLRRFDRAMQLRDIIADISRDIDRINARLYVLYYGRPRPHRRINSRV